MSLLLLTHQQNYKWYFIDDMLYLPMDIYWWTNKNTDDITYSFPDGDMLNLSMEIPTEWSM